MFCIWLLSKTCWLFYGCSWSGIRKKSFQIFYVQLLHLNHWVVWKEISFTLTELLLVDFQTVQQIRNVIEEIALVWNLLFSSSLKRYHGSCGWSWRLQRPSSCRRRISSWGRVLGHVPWSIWIFICDNRIFPNTRFYFLLKASEQSERAFSPKSIETLAQTLIRSTPIRSNPIKIKS